MPSPTGITTRCVLFACKTLYSGGNGLVSQSVWPHAPFTCVAPGGVGKHLAIHHQRRLLSVGEAEERGPWGAPVQASWQETTDSAQRSSALRSESLTSQLICTDVFLHRCWLNVTTLPQLNKGFGMLKNAPNSRHLSLRKQDLSVMLICLKLGHSVSQRVQRLEMRTYWSTNKWPFNITRPMLQHWLINYIRRA